MKEMVGGCCVCSDDRGWNENPLVYCDGTLCNVAVHQACYGIVTVPTGPWFCRKCESQERSVKVKCELCPSKHGALKRTDNQGWAHVVCALYIPEVRFGNVTTMEPIQLQLIPAERFAKVCYICEEKGKPANATVGACMNCNRQGCKQGFHVTCAQTLGLLCEEAGNYLDNVKYCGYCQYHSSKLTRPNPKAMTVMTNRQYLLTKPVMMMTVQRKSVNVKTIPPYKPVAADTQYSDSTDEVESATSGAKQAGSAGGGASSAPSSSSSSSAQQQHHHHHHPLQPPAAPAPSSSTSSSSSSKRKTGSNPKISSSSSSSSSSKTAGGSSSSSAKSSSGSHQKTVHNSSSASGSSVSSSAKSADKLKISNSGSSTRSAKSAAAAAAAASTVATADDSIDSAADNKTDTRDSKSDGLELREAKGKKRRTNSRTPTPVAGEAISSSTCVAEPGSSEKKTSDSAAEKAKKAKVETTQSILTNQPVVALTSISTIKSIALSTSSSIAASAITSLSAISTPPTATINLADSGISETPPSVPTPSSSIIQSSLSHPQVNSLVVSVPLANTSLSPHRNQVINNQTSVVTPTPLHSDRATSLSERSTPTRSSIPHSSSIINMTGGNSNHQTGGIISSEMSGGGLKIVYEKQDAVTTEVDMDLEISPSAEESSSSRRHGEKFEKMTRSKRQRAAANGMLSQLQSTVTPSKRSTRQQPSSPQLGAFSSITQSQLKDSPPSSPSSESQGATSTSTRGRTKTRRSAPASMSDRHSPKENKELKLFQNGVTAPHMLGNQLNPNSNMAQKMSDHLNSELEAHSIFNPNDNSNLVGPQLHHRVIASARASSTGGSSTASGASGLSSMLGGGGGNIPQTLDQLLERQWEQGSQFLMEQAQHFDIASLLSCLHQLRAENTRLEEHVSTLLQRRDHLLAVNARLAIPLTGQPATPQPSHPHTVNNIHPAVGASHGDIPRLARHGSSSSAYPAHPQGSQHHPGSASSSQVIENGLPPDPGYSQHSHNRGAPTAAQSQPSPSMRHSPAGSGYPSSGLLRQSADTSGRSAPRPQPYSLYQGPGPSSQQQMVIRRDSDIHHQPSSKPS